MSRRPILALGPDLPADALSAIDTGGATPAWLIDVDRGLVRAATASGAALLGLSAAMRAPPLDAAMPALHRLRELWDAGAAPGPSPEPLVFWTRAGAVRCLCRVALLRAAGTRLAAVSVHEERGAVRPAPRASPTAEASEPEAAAARARLAHELRTPLGAIAAAAEVMRDQRLGPVGSSRYLGYARDIHASATHALALIERMLADARSSSSSSASTDALAFSEVDTAALLESAVSQLDPLVARAGLTLALELPPRLPHLIADATSLRQIVLNLVTNALKFTTPGGRVTVAARYAGDGPLTIAVSDTGRGMSAQEVTDALGGRRIASDGGAADAGDTGLGLGLPLVQALAAANGATIAIESAPGRGTSVSVMFRSERVVPV